MNQDAFHNIVCETSDPLSSDLPLVHCISADAKLSVGVAHILENIYHIRSSLPTKLEVGEAYRTVHENRIIYNLVTKRRYFHKPTKEDFTRSLHSLRSLVREGEVVCPPIGCGRDCLPRPYVLSAMSSVLPNLLIHFCDFRPSLLFPEIVLGGTRNHYFTVSEFNTGTACCARTPEECTCFSFDTVNLERFQSLCNFIKNPYQKPLSPFHNTVQAAMISLEETITTHAALGINNVRPFGKIRFVYDLLEFHESLSVYIPKEAGSTRKMFCEFLSRPLLFYTVFYITQKELPAIVDISDAESEVSEVVNPAEVIPPKQSESRTTSVIKYAPKSKIRKWNKSFDFVAKDRGKAVKNVDYDRWVFSHVARQQSKGALISRLLPPTSMKVVFARDILLKSKWVRMNYPHEHFMTKHFNIRPRMGLTMDAFLHQQDDLDSFLLGLFRQLVSKRDYKAAFNRMYCIFKEFGVYACRKIWYQLSCLGMRKGIPDVLSFIETKNIQDPFEHRYDRSFIVKLPKKGSIKDIRDPGFQNFVNFCNVYHTFRNNVRMIMGYKMRDVRLTPNNLVSTYATECVRGEVKTTMFSGYKSAMSEFGMAAKNIQKIDIKNVNRVLSDTRKTMKDSRVTMDKLNNLITKCDNAGLDQLIGRFNSIMQKSDLFLNALCTPLGDQVFRSIGEFFSLPDHVTNKLRSIFTPLNLCAVTFFFIIYQHADSKLIKITAITAILHTLGLLKTGMEYFKKFVKGFMAYVTPDENEPQETASISDIFTVISTIAGGGANLLLYIISGIYSLFKGTVASMGILRVLLTRAGSFGRDVNFSFLGLQNGPKLWAQLVGAWRSVCHHLFGGTKPVDARDEWIKEYDKWRVKLLILQDPRLMPLIRASEQARIKVDELYEGGVELLKKAQKINGVQRETCALAREMSGAANLARSVAQYRAYCSERITPYVVCLTSDAGTGKTNMVHLFKNLLAKYIYPGVDADTLLYNVPIDGDHYDGYHGQQWLVLDDYNLVNDVSWVARVCKLQSNVPTIFPMAHLTDKGITNMAHGVIETTNDAYGTPNGVTHSAAILRRRNMVVHVSVPSDCKEHGHISKAAVEAYAHRILSQKIPKELTDSEERKQWLERAVAQYYYEMRYYRFEIKDPMKDKVRYTYDAEAFFTHFVTDFCEHRERELALLRSNKTCPVKDDVVKEHKDVVVTVERIQAELQRDQNLFLSYFQDEDETVEIPERSQYLFEWLKKLDRKTALGYILAPRTYFSSTLRDCVEFCAGYFHKKVLEERYGGDIEVFANEVMENVGSIPASDFAEGVNPEISEQDILDAGPSTQPEETNLSDDDDSDDETEYNTIDEQEPNYITSYEIQDEVGWLLNLTECEKLEFEFDEEPQFGWLNIDFRRRPEPGTTSTPPLQSRIATDFLMRLRIEADNKAQIELSDVMGHEFPGLINPRYTLAYPDNNHGVGLHSSEPEQSWFKESCFTFSMISEKDKWELVKTRRDMIAHWVQLREIVIEHVTPIAEERNRSNTFFAQLWKQVEMGLLMFVSIAVFMCLYIALLLGIAWLISPTPTMTKYNVDPRRQPTKNLVWKQTMHTRNVQSVRRRLADNLQLVQRKVGNKLMTAQGFYVHGSYMLLPAHFMRDLEEETTLVVTSPEYQDLDEAPPCRITKSDVYFFPNVDSCLVNLRWTAVCQKSALKYFISEKDLKSLMGTQIQILQRDPETFEIMGAVTKITGQSRINLKNVSEPVEEFLYDGAAPYGSSGGPVYSLAEKIPRSLLGVQSCSTSLWGGFTPITSEALDIALETLKLPTFEEFELDEEVYECNRSEILESTKIQTTPAREIFTKTCVVGRQRSENSMPVMAKSQLHKTPISYYLPDTGREPAIMSDFDNRRAQFSDKPHFLHKSLNKFCMDAVNVIPIKEQAIVTQQLIEYDIQRKMFDNLRVLPIDEAIVPSDLDASTLDLTTSPGLPWSLDRHKAKGKLTHLRKNELGELVYISPELQKSCECLLETLDRNVVPAYLQCDFMKDELRDATLGKQNVTRTVTVLPMHVTIVARQLMLDYHSRIHSNAKLAGRVSVGVNMDSRTSELMLQKLCSRSGGQYCIDFDVSNWDGHFPGWLAKIVVDRRNAAYQRASPTKHHSIARTCLYLSMMFGNVQIGQVVYRKYRGMSSGFCGTAEDNSEGHEALLYIIWRQLARKNDLSLIGYESYLRYVVFFVYGDDIIISVDEDVVSWFNGLSIADEYTALGWPVTPAQKGASLVASRHWSELTFLKRSFIRDPTLGVVFTPLDLETIHSLFVWMRGSELSQFYDNLRDAFRFLLHHGREEFEAHLAVIREALSLCRLDGIYCVYEDMLEQFLENYDRV